MWQLIIISLLCALVKLTTAQQELTYAADLDFPDSNDLQLENIAYSYSEFELRNKSFGIIAYAKLNWHAAQHICSNLGLTLATINRVEDNNQLRRYLTDNNILNRYELWISGSDLAVRNSWYWLSTGRPIGYNNWARGEPRNSSQTFAHCVYMGKDQRWRTGNCNDARFFVCENRCALNSYAVPLYQNGK